MPSAPVIPIDTGIKNDTPALPPAAPTAAAPIAAAPPASDRSSGVRDAGREARKRFGRRKGYLSTLLAGETGGFQGQGKTLLGQ